MKTHRPRSGPFPRGAPAEDDVSRRRRDGARLRRGRARPRRLSREDRRLQRASASADRMADARSTPAPISSIASAPNAPATSSSSPATTGARPSTSRARSKPACNVLADKPMAIDARGFESLRDAFADRRSAGRAALRHHDRAPRDHHDAAEGVLADSRRVRRAPAGDRRRSRPSSRKASTISRSRSPGAPIKRPAWFFDATQQGEGLVDITTHLVDLVQWECFPERDPGFRTRTSGFSTRSAGRPASARRSSRR